MSRPEVSHAARTGLLCLLLVPSALLASHPGEESDYGLVLGRSVTGDPVFWLDARIYLDAALYRQDELPMHNGVELRRGRLAVTSRPRPGLTWQLDVDFADDEVEVEDAWVGLERTTAGMRMGSFKEPLGLEHLVSSRYTTFLERGLVDALVPGRSMGLAFWTYGRWWLVTVGAFGQDVDDVRDQADEAHAFTGRAVVYPVWDRTHFLHLGIAATRRTPDARSPQSDRVRYRTRPETHVSRDRILNTGLVDGVDHTTSVGLEAAHVWGPLSTQAEMVGTSIARQTGHQDAVLWGFYAYASWFLSGESRPYCRSTGEFGRVRPEQPSGAWEVAGRYSWLDLNDGPAEILGGKAEAITLGANWYASANSRLLVGCTRVRTDRWARGYRESPLTHTQRIWLLQMRVMTYL